MSERIFEFLVGSSLILTVIALQLVRIVKRSDGSAFDRASYPPRI